jgi:hypothetical protein
MFVYDPIRSTRNYRSIYIVSLEIEYIITKQLVLPDVFIIQPTHATGRAYSIFSDGT